jgi:prepilin-type N-terminal cleavage/methylation domain-containing protein/prepilin-type processing-associated H-X9-DG protein
MVTYRSKRGFTLIELLVVIAVIAVLAAILFPVFAKAREKARQTQCLNNQRQIATSMLMFAQDHEETLPIATTVWGEVELPVKLLRCPSVSTKTGNTYGYNERLSGLALGDITDPTKALMLADSDQSANLLLRMMDITLRHMNKALCAYADGHVAITDTYTPLSCGLGVEVLAGLAPGALTPAGAWSGGSTGASSGNLTMQSWNRDTDTYTAQPGWFVGMTKAGKDASHFELGGVSAYSAPASGCIYAAYDFGRQDAPNGWCFSGWAKFENPYACAGGFGVQYAGAPDPCSAGGTIVNIYRTQEGAATNVKLLYNNGWFTQGSNGQPIFPSGTDAASNQALLDFAKKWQPFELRVTNNTSTGVTVEYGTQSITGAPKSTTQWSKPQRFVVVGGVMWGLQIRLRDVYFSMKP